jgi:serine O-acetyltransferase
MNVPPLPSSRPDSAARRVLGWIDRWNGVGALPLAWAVRFSDQGDAIRADVDRWLGVLHAADGVSGLHGLLYAFPEFRALYYHRFAGGNALGALLARLMRHIWRPVEGLNLATADIGPGLFIAHGHATTLSATRIGANCYVHQCVTVGWDYRSESLPIIGDDVFIGAGAVILGAVTIGDGAMIGANSVVLCDVPAGATAVGQPARVLLRAIGGDELDVANA